MGIAADKTVQFKQDLERAWDAVADKGENKDLSCDELREVLSVLGCVVCLTCAFSLLVPTF